MSETSPVTTKPDHDQSAALSKPQSTGALLLAAGFSRRFNGCKLAATLSDGQNLFTHSLKPIRDSFADILIVGREALLEQGVYDSAEGLDIVLNPDAEAGMGSSLACGARLIPDHWRAAAICLADMPQLSPVTLLQLINLAREDRIILPIHDNKPGHPVIFGAQFFAALQHCHGDSGARQIIQTHHDAVIRIPVSDAGILQDIDDQAAFQRLLDASPQLS